MGFEKHVIMQQSVMAKKRSPKWTLFKLQKKSNAKQVSNEIR